MMNESYTARPLKPGTTLHEFVIESTIGSGGFGIVYKALHKLLDETVAIKEFLPRDLARRVDGDRVEPLEGQVDAYEWARERFLSEAKTLKSLIDPQPHPNLVQVTHAFSENDTVYMCMRYEEGTPLEALLSRPGALSEQQLKGILFPLLDGLAQAHARRIWHRDIKPSNILIREDGSPVLIDFGAARRDVGRQDRSVMVQCTPGYAAPEQTWSGEEQGPWTDIYALGATLYRAITGQAPQGFSPTNLRGELAGQYSRPFLAAIDAALQPRASDRPQALADWRRQLETTDQNGRADDLATVIRPSSPTPEQAQVRASLGATPPSMDASVEPAPSHTAPPTGTRGRGRRWLWAVPGLALLLISGIGYWQWATQQPHAPSAETKGPDPMPGSQKPDTSAITLRTEAATTTDQRAGLGVKEGGTTLDSRADSLHSESGNGASGPATDALGAHGPAQAPEAGDVEAEGMSDIDPPIQVSHPHSAPTLDNLAAEAEVLATTLKCARIKASLTDDGVLSLRGHVGSSGDLSWLRDRLLDLEHVGIVSDDSVKVLSWPFCQIVADMENAVEGGYPGLEQPALHLNKASGSYREGEYLVISVGNKNPVAGYLYVDYVDNAGTVVHMLPTLSDPDNRVGGLEQIVLGSDSESTCEGIQCYEVSPPHGRSLILAIWSQDKLYSDPRPEIAEPALTYISNLARLIEDKRAKGLDKVTLGYQFIETQR